MQHSENLIRPVQPESEAKHRCSRRTRPLPGALRKLSQEAARLEDIAQREDQRNLEDHERVRAISNTVFGGAFTKILKTSPVLSDDDRDFLKELRYL